MQSQMPERKKEENKMAKCQTPKFKELKVAEADKKRSISSISVKCESFGIKGTTLKFSGDPSNQQSS